jgi:hypothetical protein
MAVGVFVFSSAYWTRAYGPDDPEDILQRASIVRAATREGEYVNLGCVNWNSAVMFYAGRRGFVTGGDASYVTIDDPRVCLDGELTPVDSP